MQGLIKGSTIGVSRKKVTQVWGVGIKIVATIAAIPLVLVFRVISPFVRVQVGGLRSNIIGHYVFDIEHYLSWKEVNKSKSMDLFFLAHKPSVNRQWDRMLERVVRVKAWHRYLFIATRFVPGGAAHRIYFPAVGSRDCQGVLSQTKPHVYFIDQEENEGQEYLRKVGLKKYDSFVCLIVRDAAYKKKRNIELGEKRDWSYHDYRNSDINSYTGAIDELIKSGFWVFRMGKDVEKPLNMTHPQLIDYATENCQSDLLDIWLMANCSFSISTCIGLDEVSRIFRRPAVYANFLPMRNMVTYTSSINAPKRLFWISTGVELTLQDHLEHGYISSQQYHKAGIQIKDLDDEELRYVIREMIERRSRRWKSCQDADERQRKFWQVMKAHSTWSTYHDEVHPDVFLSDYFLKKNPKWLG
jgi:putative glycosyltransferase (TIGR04372 family)|tara:strand:+ start:3091 stop:4332 length:1242 start_codon:yes stop_codon:yes gene_type:complete